MSDLRLHYGLPKPTWIAKDPTGNFILFGNLGVLGVGTMWFGATKEEMDSEEYKALPIKEKHE